MNIRKPGELVLQTDLSFMKCQRVAHERRVALIFKLNAGYPFHKTSVVN